MSRRSRSRTGVPALLALLALGGAAACGTDSESGSRGRTEGRDAGSAGGASGADGAAGTAAGGVPSTGGATGIGGSSGAAASFDGGGASGSDAGGGGVAGVSCPELPKPAASTVISAGPADVANLPAIVAGATTGQTIELADGTYALGSFLRFATPGVTLRSASGDASSVTLDGGYSVNETVVVTASDVTIAHVTITRAVDHPIHIYPPDGGPDVKGTLVYGVRIVDGGEQFIKVNPAADLAAWIDDGRVECSTFELTDEGRMHVESCCGGCYTGGIDAHAARGWVVRNNEFRNIYCDGAGLAEHAVHFWRGSRDTLVENNVIVNCARGVGFGLGGGTGPRVYSDAPYGAADLAHYDGIIRNNVVYASIPWYDTGIELDIARRPLVYHNTLVETSGATGFFSSIDYRFAETDVEIQNNLTRRITVRDGAQGTVSNNLESTPLSYFVDPAGGDFHLTSSATQAIDQGVVVAEAGVDLDGELHEIAAPDLGADEHGAP